MKKTFTAVLVASALSGNLANAQVQKAPDTINQMVKVCTVEKGEVAEARCEAFVAGVVDTTRLYASIKPFEPPFCIPAETPLTQVVTVYKTYLTENRSLKRYRASALAVSAFRETYPCS